MIKHLNKSKFYTNNYSVSYKIFILFLFCYYLIYFSYQDKIFAQNNLIKKSDTNQTQSEFIEDDLKQYMQKMQNQIEFLQKTIIEQQKKIESLEQEELQIKNDNKILKNQKSYNINNNISSLQKKLYDNSANDSIYKDNNEIYAQNKNRIDISKIDLYLESRASGDSPQSNQKTINKTSKVEIDGAKMYREAYKILQQSNTDNPNKNFNNALKSMESFVKLYPDHSMTANAYYWIGEIYMFEKQYADAASSYLRGYIAPKNDRSIQNLLGLAHAYSKLGMRNYSCSVIMHMRKEYPDADILSKKEAAQLFTENGC